MKKWSMKTHLPSGMAPDGSSNVTKTFNWFLAARIISQFATMGFSFYIVYALRRFQMDAVTAGYLTATLTISQMVANAGMGWLGDRVGHRLMLIIGAAAANLSSLLAWFAPSLAWFFPVFVLSGFANVSIWTNGMTMTVDFSDEKERPFYIGLAQTLTAPATIIAPLIGGWIADTQGFVSTFALSTILSIVMMAILVFLVRDPARQGGAQPPRRPYDSHSGKSNQAIEILKEQQTDMWLTFVRETSGVRDPALDLLIGPNDLTWPSALILTRKGEKIAIIGNLEKDALQRLDVFDEILGYDKAVRELLRETITRLNPDRIAVNTSRNNVHADGLNSCHVRDPARTSGRYTLRRIDSSAPNPSSPRCADGRPRLNWHASAKQ